MTEEKPLLVDIDAKGVATVTLARPQVHNAFDDVLIAKLTETFAALGRNEKVRAVLLAAQGENFSAGADLNWMKRMAGYSEAENRADAMKLAQMLAGIAFCPKPVIGLVHGAVFGGGVGLTAACDMAVATIDTGFSLSEVKLGIIPSVISPYVIEAIGARAARRYFLTAERFDAPEAYRLGLVSEIVEAKEMLRPAADRLIGALLKNGPNAISRAKELIQAVAHRPITGEVMEDTARRIAETRASPEGKEGLAAFLEKRKPGWIGG